MVVADAAVAAGAAVAPEQTAFAADTAVCGHSVSIPTLQVFVPAAGAAGTAGAEEPGATAVAALGRRANPDDGARVLRACRIGAIDGIYACAAVAAATEEETSVAAVATEGAVAAGAPQKSTIATSAEGSARRVDLEGVETVAEKTTARTDDRQRPSATPRPAPLAWASPPSRSRPPQLAGSNSNRSARSANPVDASFTSAVVGAGAPGAVASRTPVPTIAAAVTPALTYWRAAIPGVRDLGLLCLDTGGTPFLEVKCLRRQVLLRPGEKGRASMYGFAD